LVYCIEKDQLGNRPSPKSFLRATKGMSHIHQNGRLDFAKIFRSNDARRVDPYRPITASGPRRLSKSLDLCDPTFPRTEIGVIRMMVQKRRFPVLLMGVFALLGSTATAPGQTIVVTAKSVNDLADDLEYVIKTVAPPGDQTVQVALDNLGKFKEGELIKGLDRGRGFALAVTLPKDFPQGGPPSVVAAVPVSDNGQFLDSLKALGLDVDDNPGAEGFSHKVSLPNGPLSLYVLQSKGYALFSMLPDGADKLRNLDPTAWSKKSRPETAMSVRVQLAEIPDALKDQFLNQMEGQAAQQRERKPNEKDAEFKARVAGQDLALEAFKSLVHDGDALALELGLDRKTSELSLDLAMTARPDTAMAKNMRSLNGRRSRFEGLGRDSALGLWASLPVAKELRDVMARGFDQGFKEGLDKVTSEEQRKLLERSAELIKSNLDAPEIDLGMAIRRSAPAGQGDPHFLIVAGMRIRDGQEFDRLVREAIAKAKPEEGYKVAFDVAKAKDGTAINEMTGPLKNANPDALRQFGKPSLAFAFRADAALFVFGEDSTDALRRTLDDSSTPVAGRSDGPAGMSLRMATLGELAGKNQEGLRRATAEVFKGEGPKHDRIFLGLTGEGDGIRVRLAMDLLALKLAVMMGHQPNQ
jgi:hypothetical protein